MLDSAGVSLDRIAAFQLLPGSIIVRTIVEQSNASVLDQIVHGVSSGALNINRRSLIAGDLPFIYHFVHLIEIFKSNDSGSVCDSEYCNCNVPRNVACPGNSIDRIDAAFPSGTRFM